MPFSRIVTWFGIVLLLTLSVGAYWFFTREFKGQAAETTNIAHTEALTATNLGLQGYWTLDGNDIKWSDTTTEIKDTSGNSRHGDAQGSLATTSVTPGRVGQSLLFNGTSDLISLGNVYNGIKTVSFWVKPNSTTQPFIDLNGTATINMTSGTVAANNFTSPTIYIDGTATSTFPDTNWHHVTITTNTGINASAVNLGKISSSYFGGTMDDIRFYSAALSSTQVTELYRSSGAKETDNAAHRDVLTNGLVGYWTFDGRDINWSDSTTEIKDISGNSNHGDAAGSLSTTSVTPGKLGQALSFNGSSDYVDINENVNLPVYKNNVQLSISLWVKAATVSGFHTLFAETPNAGGSFPHFRMRDVGTGKLAIKIRNSAGGTDINDALSSSTVFDNTWHHIVWVDNNGTAALYVDGIQDATNFSYTRTSMTDLTQAALGFTPEWGDTFFGGIIDDVRIYGRVLLKNEIVSLFSAGR